METFYADNFPQLDRFYLLTSSEVKLMETNVELAM